MTAFIRQEALEKAREIQLKADEEFAIEKSKLVRQETAAIDLLYEKKFKQASMSQQITRSTLANRTRLRVLSARQELLNELFERARERVAGVSGQKTKGGADYGTILQGLILEGLYALNEDKVAVRARKGDYALVKKAIEGATKEFKKTVGRDIKVEIDESEPLPDGSYVPILSIFPYCLPRETKLTILLEREVSLSSVQTERSMSTTPLKNACGYSKPTPFQLFGKRYSARTKTGSSTTRLYISIILPSSLPTTILFLVCSLPSSVGAPFWSIVFP